MQEETNEASCSTKILKKDQDNTTLIQNDQKEDSFQPYQFLIPDVSIHGEGFFVAALPAQPRAERTHCDIGQQPMWHPDASKIGGLFDRDSVFVKYFKDGSISLIYEQQLRHRGLHGYSLTIVDGQILPSDGIGFVFADRVPCSKNIKRLWSIFVNRTGHIIKRMGSHMERQANPHLPPLQIGNCVTMILDLDKYVACFQTTDSKGKILARAKIDLISFAEKVDASQGYLCAVLTKSGVVLRMKKASVDILDQPDVPYHFELHSHTKSINFSGYFEANLQRYSNYSSDPKKFSFSTSSRRNNNLNTMEECADYKKYNFSSSIHHRNVQDRNKKYQFRSYTQPENSMYFRPQTNSDREHLKLLDTLSDPFGQGLTHQQKYASFDIKNSQTKYFSNISGTFRHLPLIDSNGFDEELSNQFNPENYTISRNLNEPLSLFKSFSYSGDTQTYPYFERQVFNPLNFNDSIGSRKLTPWMDSHEDFLVGKDNRMSFFRDSFFTRDQQTLLDFSSPTSYHKADTEVSVNELKHQDEKHTEIPL